MTKTDSFCFTHMEGQSPHAAENSLDRARIWFLAACSLSSEDRRSGGPSVPTVTRPESSPRADMNVNRNEPGPSSTSAICWAMLKPFPSLGSQTAERFEEFECPLFKPLSTNMLDANKNQCWPPVYFSNRASPPYSAV